MLGSRKRLLVAATLALVALGAIGGGVYAAFGGAGQSQSLSSSPINLDQGLIARYKMDGNAKDSTPNANNGTVSSATPTTDREGKVNGAYAFNGSSMITTGVTNFPNIGSSASYSAWFKPTVAGSDQMILRIIAGGVDLRLRYTVFNTLGFNSNGSDRNSASITLNTWHLATVTYDGTNQRQYLDGVLVDTFSTTLTSGTPTSMLIGTAGGSENFNGSMDDVRIYNRAINASEATALYNSYDTTTKVDVGANSLVGQYKIDGNAKDSSPYANNGTTNNVTLVADRKGRSNSAYSFNGTNSYINLPVSTAQSSTVFTMSAWIYPTSSASTATIIGSNAIGGPQFRVETNLTLGLVNQGANNIGFSTGTVQLNQWSHVAVSYDASGNFKFYINGQSAGSNNNLRSLSYSYYRIGAPSIGAGELFTGSIDDVRIYNRVLAQSEVQQQADSYNAGLQVSNLQSGLIADYPFNGNAKDGTPNASNGTVTGATLTTDRKTRPNSAYNFSNAYINAGNTSALQIPAGGSVTMCVWVYPTSGPGSFAGVVGKRNATSYDYSMNYTSANFQIQTDGGSSNGIYAYVPPLSTWTHICGVITTSPRTILYINGQVFGNSGGAGGGVANTGQTLNIGSSYPGAEYFLGKLDDVRIYNRVLSAAEVNDLYNSYR